MVAGGWDALNMGWYLDSVETFTLGHFGWVTSKAKLPRPMGDLRAINIDGRVLIFGRSLYLYFYLS